MTREEINALERRQLELRATMQKSDEHALKCAKSGLDFRETYPEPPGRSTMRTRPPLPPCTSSWKRKDRQRNPHRRR